jgi:hypothetical protein
MGLHILITDSEQGDKFYVDQIQNTSRGGAQQFL